MARALEPVTFEEAASGLAAAGAEGHAVRIVGGATKLGWGRRGDQPAVELHTSGMDRIVEHNTGDLTAVLQAGVPLARAQATFANAGQMLALDPPLGAGATELGATIGGVLATADSGPLRHRYGAPRDLVVGITVALSDGTIARAGGKVIKNVAGYDLAKLFAGSFGTLGVILAAAVRLHPAPPSTATALGASDDPDVLAAAARALTAAPLELEALDVWWRAGRGGILAQAGGAEAERRTKRIAPIMAEAGLEQVDVAADDQDLWARQRGGQRSQSAAVMRIGARPSALADVVRATEACGGALVGRAALGLSFVELDPEAVGRLRDLLGPGPACVILDVPAQQRDLVDPWGPQERPALDLMWQLKARFDPIRACNPGVFVGGI
jgi:glycolate oxidase FAD binding subunit